MKSKYQKELESLAAQREENQNDILRQEGQSTFENLGHNMQVEAGFACLSEIYQDLQDMEKAELCDHMALERKYGRANKKR